jgi:diguanylate cyclase (GGDEF)-like protein/PAS domain S-box-containing protein
MPAEEPGLSLSGTATRQDDVGAAVLAALAELPDSTVTVFDRDLRHVLVRGSALAAGGLRSEDVEGAAAPDVLEPDVWAFYRPLYEAALRGERRQAEVSSRDGRRHYLVRVGPVRDGSGDVVGGVVIATDVTELTDARRDLAEIEERYSELAENSSGFVLRVRADGVVERVSASVRRILGWAPEQLEGLPSGEFVHPDDLAGLLADITPANVGRTVSGRVRLRCRDGSFRWMTRTLRPMVDDDGTVVARVSGWRDVQREVDAEEALEASEEQFRLAMDTSSTGMFFCSLKGRFLRVNPALCRMLGYSAAELTTMSSEDITHPADRVASREQIAALLRREIPVLRMRKRYVTRSGATIWGDVSGALVRGTDGTPRHIIGQVADVSVEIANAEALRRAATEFRMLAENASDIVYRVTTDGVFEWVSPSMVTVLGWDPAQLVGTSSADIMVAEDRAQALERRTEVAAGNHSPAVVIRFRTSWGGVREMSGTTHPVWSDDGTEVVGAIVGLRDVTEEQRIRRELAYRASHDSLTGVANRDDLMTRLRRHLEAPAEEEPAVGVLFCDVDNLKSVNDAYGHPVGDAVLATVAERLVASVRGHDVVARIGGDEFVVVLGDVAGLGQLSTIAEKCRRAVAEPIVEDGRSIEVTVSVGAVLAAPNEDADDVLKRADGAVYRAKQAGRDRVSVEDALL